MNCKCCKADCVRRGEHREKECKWYIPMTNADRIRAMTDEELAKHFSGLICDINEGVEFNESPNIWLEWLKQPAGGEP